MKRWLLLLAGFVLASWFHPSRGEAFCGFYVAKGDAKLFNHASQVVMARDADRTVITMVNDYKGDPKEFAVVVPVPTFLERDQIHIGDKAVVDHLDAYSAPRLVEYFDPCPCQRQEALEVSTSRLLSLRGGRAEDMVAMGEAVTVEARYTVGEYDIVILSATESRGLERWLRHNGYRIPAGAARVLGSYIRQNLHFFVAKVNLKEQKKLGFTYLRPIQVAYESPKFMLPVRLGTVNADGPQELFLYTITRKGRVEPVNYRSSRLPSDTEVPEYVKEEFARFYRSLFEERVRKEGMQSVFLEYAWDMASCDPCAAEPLSREELSSLGVFWLGNDGGPQQTFVTRLHARYDAAHFPTDLVFQETGDRASFQGRFVLRHPWKGTEDCPEMARYRRDVRDREETQAKTLADLTGWRLGDIRHRMAIDTPLPEIQEVKWYQRLWPRASR